MNKHDRLASLLVEREPHLVILCETWTNADISNAEISFPGYNLIVRKDRLDTLNGRGGGLLIYSKEGTIATEINTKSQFHQLGGVLLEGNIEIYGVYRSPNSSAEENKLLNEFVSKRRQKSLIIGDINYPNIDWESSHSNNKEELAFVDSVIGANFSQLVESPTHEKGNILDLILTNWPDLVENVEVNDVNEISDHFLLTCEVLVTNVAPHLTELVPDLAKADFNLLRCRLEQINWHKVLQDKSADESWATFKNIVLKVMKECIPMKLKKANSQPLWMNKNVLRCIRKKKRLWKHYTENGSLDKYFQYRKEANNVIKMVESTKKEFEESLVCNTRGNQRKFFSYMRSKTKSRDVIGPLKNKEGSLISDEGEKCSVLNEFFSSVFTREEDNPGDNDIPEVHEDPDGLSDIYL